MAKKRLHFDILACTILLVFGFFCGQLLGRWSGYEQMRPVKQYQIEQPTVGRHFLEVKVFCWITTHPASHKTKAYAVANTWGQLCNRIVFVSNGTDEKLPIILVNISESRGQLWSKTRKAFKWIYKNVLNDYDWFLKADDDTYVHMDNLRALLLDYSPNDPLVIGHLFQPNIGHGVYHSGGAGYVLSRDAVKRLVGRGFAKFPICNKKNAHEDVFLGTCLNKLNVTFVDGADKNGAYRFHAVALYDFLDNHVPKWLRNKSKTKLKMKSFEVYERVTGLYNDLRWLADV
ncbi:hypothetical protein RB195_012231 [Necator americanus]|uniref:N-acetylgalactosaminide beta-1,3-galactosyltransferase n=1 Tax=Necator americanus TaxID=51031 RepID=A0ABR1D640_NECAM